jgi:hypothetical protein
MITLGASSARLQASRARPSGRPAVPRGYRPITRQQLQQRRRIVAAAAGRDNGDNPLRFDDRSTSEVPSDMAPGLKDQQVTEAPGTTAMFAWPAHCCMARALVHGRRIGAWPAQ